jgi:16S rRNA (cytosine967-C5)-methyltransferase
VPDAASWVKIAPARRAAFEVLMAVGQSSAHSDDLLHGRALAGLSETDRNLTTALVMGVLRWQIALDARIAPLLSRPEMPPQPVLVALRLGVFQLGYMDRIPAHAALSESVELCRASGNPHAAGMVNAVLRKLTVTPAKRAAIAESPAALAERLAHPLWLLDRWIRHFGRATAERIAAADQAEPARTGGLFEPDTTLPAMDDGSRLVAELAAAALPTIFDQAPRIWDCCAAPGGKTLVLSARLPEADILATDVSLRRLEALRQRVDDAGATKIRCVAADAMQLPFEEGAFDLILLDVPCSGTGTLARNPEIRHRLQPADLRRQAERQRELLNSALSRLAPGGRLVYSTCSLEPEENVKVTADASGLRRVPVADLLARVPSMRVPIGSVCDGEVLRTLPGVNPCDGFTAVVLERDRADLERETGIEPATFSLGS